MKKILLSLKLILFIVTLSTFSCSKFMATFDQAAYSQVTALKVDALALMDKSSEDYTLHITDVKAFQLELDKAIEYDKLRPNNDLTNKEWAVLIDPSQGLLGDFLAKWSKDGKLGAAYIADKKKQIGDSIDQIAGLEIKKLKQ